ncbi:WD40/YVTN/BNR-like repeat-containing protein [Gelidibacter maritimus]|uniref:Oxidoreductase n=1 Tax=Gelidibacter maritimus TaxID=2761487 RepID=A0A7W2M205_9FLAO|nr:oxidoreductase [Gelidibacter maritimus]MBA6151263.1 oxidoreductase [Gelidibacter maritimus]
MRILTSLLLLTAILSCKQKETPIKPEISSVEIEEIFKDSTLSIRAIDVASDKSLAFAANNGVFGLYNPQTDEWATATQNYDTLNLQFRAVARTSNDFFMLSVENPALLFKTGENGEMEVVYKEEHEKVFYDALSFWNSEEGIAIGDPIDGCMSIIITRDGGETWTKLPCEVLPKSMEGEAAFAASNTNIAIVGNKTWVATGGKTSRILFSGDKGKSWEASGTPMVNGENTTGIYSVDFYDETNGFAIGGDYTKPDESKANKMRTSDGGKTWQLVGDGEEPGYRSCVQYVPNSQGKKLVAIGFKGIDYSSDSGSTWNHLSDEGFYTLQFLNDTVAYAAGKGRIARLKFQ